MVAVLFVIFAARSLFGVGHGERYAAAEQGQARTRAAPARIWPVPFAPAGAFGAIHLGGRLVTGAGEPVDLGGMAAWPGGALAAWLVGKRELVMPSCLTAPPPEAGARTPAALPVRDDLPGFYGAPWTADVAGNLVVLLHVTAPKDAALPAADTVVQIYRGYDGHAVTPDYAAPAAVRVYRGGGAVLYRVFAGAPLRCIDLVVPTGQPAGTAYLYYQRARHYFEVPARFVIQK